MAPKVGLEPTTTRLTAACSTIELLWNSGTGNVWIACQVVKRFSRDFASSGRLLDPNFARLSAIRRLKRANFLRDDSLKSLSEP